jgi:hypothetical protein
MSVSSLHILVVGGGAAGFFGAIAAAEAHPTAQVTLLEAGREPLQKVRISGGGRCNVTHACFDPTQLVQSYPRGGKALRGAFSRFQPQHTLEWFRQRGVQLKTEPDGRMFPVTDQSETIVDCLLQAAQTAGIKIRTLAPVAKVVRQPAHFEVSLRSGEILQADRLLLATGSSAPGFHLAQSLGHTIEPPVPSLFTFNIPDPDLRSLAGITVPLVKARLLVPQAKPLDQSGPLLVTHWGVSGPAILRLSAWGARLLNDCRYRATLQIQWLPNANPETLRQQFMVLKTDAAKRAIASHCPFTLPRRLWQYLVQKAGISPDTQWAQLSKAQLNQLIQVLLQGSFPIQGKGVFKEEFVTCGGVRLSEVDFKTMQSRICPELYFAGEILDIDGITGGFNFQSAWTTGWLAGQAIGK